MIDRNPYRVDGPAVIAFSGGRTSGYMLRSMIDAHGGALPVDVVPVFCNTGKEHEETLKFIHACGWRWRVPIRWVEWADHETPQMRFKEVTFDTAARNGEPFAAVIKSKTYLPNPVTRFCTSDLKIKTSMNFARSVLGFDEEHYRCVGLRADEPGRVSKGRARYLTGKDSKAGEPVYPLYEAGAVIADVAAFWKSAPFDLGLPMAANGTTPAGNCDLCFLKSAGKINSIIATEPHRAIWWARQEQLVGHTFRKDRQSYSAMLAQGSMDFDGDDTIDCNCTD